MDWVTIVSILTALGVGSVVGILIKARIDKPKREAEVKKAIADAKAADELNKAHITEIFAATAERLVNASNGHFDELQEQINELKAEITKKDFEAETMSNELETLRVENKVKDEKIEKLEQNYEKLKGQYDDLKQKYDVLVLQYEKLTKE